MVIKRNKMKQTAVEWFNDEILIHLNFDQRLYLKDIFEQAQEMEKEQHEETFNQSRLAKIFEKDMPPVWESWEQYYNETFKSE
jgi:hypothetical protein